jgi:phosphatidylinositol-3-phosphatase
MRRGAIAMLLGALLAVPAQAGAAAPAIKHVFVIVLENKDYDASFGPNAKSQQLGKVLPSQGVLLTHYYGIAHNSLPNYIAMVSGQGPNPVTQSDCQVYQEFFPGTIGADGQAMGFGCVYPSSVKTVADQLTASGLTWGGYMEDMGNTTTEDKTCRHPALNSVDGTQSATATDQYAARHNPFVYFHSIIDSPDCNERDVPLDRLQADLQLYGTTPNLTFITPDLCSDGHDEPCADGRPGGYASIDAFLKEWVPRIQASPAYQQDGALVVTFDESESGAEGCCVEDHPNTPNAGGQTIGPGGGRTGTVVISPFVRPGTTTDTPYNHYSFLRTLEDLFGLAPLGYAGRSTAFGADVFNGGPAPTRAAAPASACRTTRLGRRGSLARGTLIAGVDRVRRTVSVRMAHDARVLLKADGRRFALRRAGACRTVSARVPSGARRVVIKATVRDAREIRAVRVR